MRLDVYLQKHFPFRSRSEAQDWIRQGWVCLQRGNEFLEKNKIKCAFQVEEGEGTEGVEWTEGAEGTVKPPLRVHLQHKERLGNRASRAFFKLKGAIQHLGLERTFTRSSVLDLGIGRGGFAQCLLEEGVPLLIGLDVGKESPPLSLRKKYPQLKCFRGVHVGKLNSPAYASIVKCFPLKGFDVLVADLSFISLEKILPSISSFLSRQGRVLVLVKPQFEGRPCREGAHGGLSFLCKEELQKVFWDICQKCGWKMRAFFPSAFTGKKGTQEFFLYATFS